MQSILGSSGDCLCPFLYSTWIQEVEHDTWARFQHGAALGPDATTCVQAKELPLGTVPPGASLVYAIELVSLEKVRTGAHAGALRVFNIEIAL